MQVVIRNLRKFTNYLVWVTGSTALGDGNQMSDAIKVQTLEDVPGPTSNLNCTAFNKSTMMVRWEPPMQANGVLLSYTLKINERETKILNTNTNHYILTDLTPFTQYTASISAQTTVGDGPISTCNATTLQSVPDKPSQFKLVSYNDTSSLVSWETPTNKYGVIINYILEHIHNNVTTKQNITPINNKIKILTTNLLKHSEYKTRCAAFTMKGQGNWTRFITFTTLPGVPEQKVQELSPTVVNSTAIRVTWLPGQPLTGVTYFMVNVSTNTAVIIAKNESLNNAEIFNLQPYTEYIISVTPHVYGVGTPGPTSLVTVTTDEARPSSPVRNISIINITQTTVTINFLPPAKPNGVITSYSIMTSLDNKQLVNGNQTKIKLKNLKPYKVYNVTVMPHTKMGKGPKAILTFQTLEGVPEDSPQKVQVTNITDQSASLHWEPPTLPNGIIRTYTIRYQSNDGQRNIISSKTQVQLTNLAPFTNYSIQVYAWTTQGMGKLASRLLYFTTHESEPSAPTNLECKIYDNYKILVTWGLPLLSNGRVIGYKLSNSVLNDTQTYFIKPPQSNQTLQHLQPYTEYFINVNAVTSAGWGPSANCNITTGEGCKFEKF
ncbi:phosphatidylinositol phosphatase PTPRQ-like [Ciona intestinalis]